MRERVTGEHVDRVRARLFEPAADLDRVFDRVAFRSPREEGVAVLGSRYLDLEVEVRPHLRTDRAHDVQ